jgi:hypothetical protein
MMPHDVAVYRSAWDAFVADMPENINTVMVVAKDHDGNVLYNTENENALRWEARPEQYVNLRMLAEYLREEGLYLAVRISSFGDPLAARADRNNNAIMHQSGTLWLDNALNLGGKPWLNPYARAARNYLQELALETVRMGAVYVLFDQYQFPADPTGVAVFGETGGVTRHEMLTAFAREMNAVLAEQGVRFSIFLPVRSLDGLDPFHTQMIYGGNPASIAAEIALSMNLNFLPGSAQSPAEALAEGVNRAVGQLADAGSSSRMLPVIAVSDLLTRERQLDVLLSLGIEEYILL